MMLDYVLAIVLVSLASGRIAYALTNDEIFRPMREWVWLRSPGWDSKITLLEDTGDREIPARLMHQVDGAWEFTPELGPRRPGWIGRLLECVFCMSFWTSVAAWLAYLVLPIDALHLLVVFAVWAIANTYASKGL